MLFDLAYNSQGGFPWDVLYDMPVYLRRFYWDKLLEVKKKEKEEMDKSNKGPSRRR